MRSVLRRHELRLSSGLAFPATGYLFVGARGAVSGGGPAARPVARVAATSLYSIHRCILYSYTRWTAVVCTAQRGARAHVAP